MARILLGVTGSVAAVRAPDLVRALLAAGHEVRVVATEPALYFFDPAALPDTVTLYRERDEWPGTRYSRDDPVLHIELRKWADLGLVAPLDANTLGKLALGISDNGLSCILRAWDFARPLLLAPAMNTAMWESPVTVRHLRLLLADHGGIDGGGLSLANAAELLRRYTPSIRLVDPITKRLACGDEGVGAMAEVVDLVAAVADVLAEIHAR
jgi:phosphopantothenoylcysteine decarboxylase